MDRHPPKRGVVLHLIRLTVFAAFGIGLSATLLPACLSITHIRALARDRRVRALASSEELDTIGAAESIPVPLRPEAISPSGYGGWCVVELHIGEQWALIIERVGDELAVDFHRDDSITMGRGEALNRNAASSRVGPRSRWFTSESVHRHPWQRRPAWARYSVPRACPSVGMGTAFRVEPEPGLLHPGALWIPDPPEARSNRGQRA